MKYRRNFLKAATAMLSMALAGPVAADSEKKIHVVTTFSILADMVEQIGGDHVSVTSLVGRNGDTHVYQPTPAAARMVSEAELLIVNGLEFEGWLDRLIDASEFAGSRIVATTGIDVIAFEDAHDEHGDDEHKYEDDHHAHDEHGHDEHKHEDDHHAHNEHGHDEHKHEDNHHAHDEHGHDEHKHEDDHHAHDEHGHDEHKNEDDHQAHDEHGHGEHDHAHGEFDPHGWQSLGNAVTYVDNITAALAQFAPEHAATFYQNRAIYVEEIQALDAEIKAQIVKLPQNKRTVVTSHDAFQYFGRDYGLRFLAPQGLSTESEASAKNVARLIEHMREEGVTAVFFENITDRRLLEQIANETGASIGGTLYPGALSELDGPAPTYLDMMRHNAQTIVSALR